MGGRDGCSAGRTQAHERIERTEACWHSSVPLKAHGGLLQYRTARAVSMGLTDERHVFTIGISLTPGVNVWHAVESRFSAHLHVTRAAVDCWSSSTPPPLLPTLPFAIYKRRREPLPFTDFKSPSNYLIRPVDYTRRHEDQLWWNARSRETR